MGFWGVEIKPGKPHPYHTDNVRGKLHITQATLGLGSSKERVVLQCTVGHKSPIILCSLLPNHNETCGLDLKFDEDDDVVAFSVVGPRSIHLSGYFVAYDGDHLRDEYDSDSYGEDIADTDSEDESTDYDYDSEDDSENDFIDDDDDLEMFPPSAVPNSGVVIEEILDDEKPTNGNEESKRSKKKNKSIDSQDKNNSNNQLVVRKRAGVTVLESEDEDGFPVSVSGKGDNAVQEPKPEAEKQREKVTTDEGKIPATDDNEKKRKVKSTDEDGLQERKKKKKQKEKGRNNNGLSGDEVQPAKVENQEPKQVLPIEKQLDQPSDDRVLNLDTDNVSGENLSEKKKKKKKNKKKTTQENEVAANAAVSQIGDKDTSTLKSEDKQTASKSSQVRTYPNGLIVEELAMGKPDGKRASRGKQVLVHYIGKLKKNGKIFDSNVGKAPYKFRLGIGKVITGWDVGVEGMRVGDKRKLVIPPSMGYGSKGYGRDIPPNSWLEFDVELVGVN